MYGIFNKCISLTTLDLSNFNSNNVKDLYEMYCDLNRNCKIICNDKEIKNYFYFKGK